MRQNQWQQVEQVFLRALERSPAERVEFISVACAGDEAIRREVESLLASHENADGFMDSPAFEDGLKVVADSRSKSAAGQRAGAYRIVREIGRGGMGAVYLAERADEQYNKQVALKFVRHGADSDFMLDRFFRERQILANLDHPNIARLVDGGTTEDGTPYLAMDYVEGEPFDAYCDQKRLPTVERLRLFLNVCSAVHYTHQNLVIHRDIKPGNILVTDDGTPKLLDFGIAKLLEPELGQTADRNETIARLMTPQYASPEQARGETITTASDVYSLGVLLYRLLTGHHPYTFRTPVPSEVERTICEQDPEKPSTMISRVEETTEPDGTTTTITPESVSAARGEEPIRLRRHLEGDLDNIILMAIRKDPQRRYSSVEQFAEDIRRHLEGLPVIARKDTLAYRGGKFIRRHKAVVASAALVVLILIAGIVATAWQAWLAANQAKLATEQRDRARIETAKAERISAFLKTILSYADPSWYSPSAGKRGEVKVIDALNEAAGRIDTELADQPEVRAELHHTIGSTFLALELFEKAEHHLRASLELYQAIYGKQHPKVAEGLYYLGAVMHKSDMITAEALYRQAIEMMRAVDKENINLPYMLDDFGGLLAQRGDPAAEAILGEASELFRQRYGDEHFTVTDTYLRFGILYESQGELERAQAIGEEALRRERRLPDPQAPINCLIFLSRIHIKKGEYTQAEAYYAEELDLARKYAGHNYPSVVGNLSCLSYIHYLKRDYVKAEKEARNALELCRQMPSGTRDFMTDTLSLLSLILVRSGKPAHAQSYLREALTQYRERQSKGDTLYDSGMKLGECLILLRRYPEAESQLRESYEYLKAQYGEQNPSSVEARQHLVNLYEAWGKPEQAARFRAEPQKLALQRSAASSNSSLNPTATREAR